jgi:hypothetical protein
MTPNKEYGDIRLVMQMAKARRMGRTKQGYCYDHVKRVIAGTRKNAGITALYNEVLSLRTPTRSRK